MPDREKVIRGLEICRHRVISQENCKECPYIYDGRAKQSNCEGVLHWDALELLKEQNGLMLALEQSNAANEYLNAEVERLTGLLKEQEAVEPQIAPFPDASRSDGSWYYICGACSKPIDPNDKYCRECGKPILWEDR